MSTDAVLPLLLLLPKTKQLLPRQGESHPGADRRRARPTGARLLVEPAKTARNPLRKGWGVPPRPPLGPPKLTFSRPPGDP